MKRFFQTLALMSCLLVPGLAQADNLARDYIPAPPGTFATFLYYVNGTNHGSAYHDGDKVSNTDNVDISTNVGLLRMVYWTEIGPFVVDPQFILPFGSVHYDDNTTTSWSSSGIGDLQLLATFWFLNDPESKMWLGFTPFVFIPTGDYDGGRGLGENRWHFRAEADFVKGFEVLPGHNIYFQFLVGGDFYTENDDKDLKQDPVFNFEHHTSYDLTEKMWISADYYFKQGGETEVGDIDQGNAQTKHTVGMTLAWNFLPDYQIAAQYANDVSVEEGYKNQQLLLRFLYVTDFDSLVGKKAKK